MDLLDLTAQPLWVGVAVYTLAAAAVWMAGKKASLYADSISRRTGIGGAIVGMVLLGAMTSLPEIGTSASAALAGNADMAVSNLLGGVAFQVVVLAIVDVLIGRDAVTTKIMNPSILLQIVACVLLLGLAAAATIVGDFSILGVGAWSTGMVVAYVVCILFVRDQEREAGWLPQDDGAPLDPQEQQGNSPQGAAAERKGVGAALILRTAAVGAVILVAGFLLTRSAEAIAGHTGLSTELAGLTLLAIATSLPELSTAIAAVKLGRNDLAIGDVFGGNLFDLVLIFFVDALYAGPAVLGEVSRFASFAALLGIVLSTIYLIGIIERRDLTLFRMGYDSILVLLCYAGGVVLLFSLALG
ncbi:sodium:calcium antiporter [Altererythrobacter soli]|uniref:Sodium:calcium antiporter n=1 Tax=Croceibacterium soli TaxID=1739690 RepID=A0A6I4UV41_9SPHN|nr:sodium:calcium antiporter [Croceibacterium soli]MXP42426.1 sodium:calcium antiporter [Croceibacterium soli]